MLKTLSSKSLILGIGIYLTTTRHATPNLTRDLCVQAM